MQTTSQDLKPLANTRNKLGSHKIQAGQTRQDGYESQVEQRGRESRVKQAEQDDHESQTGETQTEEARAEQVCPNCGNKILFKSAQVCGKMMHFRIMCKCEEQNKHPKKNFKNSVKNLKEPEILNHFHFLVGDMKMQHLKILKLA